MKASRRRRGFALVAALFLLVLLSSVGGAMLDISAAHQSTLSMAVLGSRAYYAARSGVEWAVYAAENGTACPSASFSLSEGAAAGFDVAVSCSTTDHVEGPETRATLQIRSTASYGSFGDRDYVSRTVDVTVVR